MAYDGGKGGAGVIQRIINLIPPHRVLVETHAGDVTLIRNIRRARRTIAIDLDHHNVDRLNRDDALTGVEVILDEATDWLSHEFAARQSLEWSNDWFFFIDPPYPIGSRSNQEAMYYR